MATINGRACVKDGKAVDAVYQGGIKVYSRNLYTNTRDFDNPNIWNNFGVWSKSGEIYNGMTVMSTTGDWSGLSQTRAVKSGEIYTYSVYVRYKSGTGNSDFYSSPQNVVNTTEGYQRISLNENWQRISITFTVVSDGSILPRLERSHDNTNTLLIAGPKLERGSVATLWTPAPEDVM